MRSTLHTSTCHRAPNDVVRAFPTPEVAVGCAARTLSKAPGLRILLSILFPGLAACGSLTADRSAPVAQRIPVAQEVTAGRFARVVQASARVDSAEAAFKDGRYGQAGILYEEAAPSLVVADRDRAWFNAARSYAKAGQDAAALRALQVAVHEGWADGARLASDPDLQSLRASSAWRPLAERVAANRRAKVARMGNADSVRVVSEDLRRFWAAYDAALPALAAHDTIAAAAILERTYLDVGTDGLVAYAVVKLRSAERFAGLLMRYPEYYASIREQTLALPAAEPDIRGALRRLTALYPDAIFPDLYLLIGGLTSGGTSLGPGLLLGTEMISAVPDSPLDELSPGRRAIVASPMPVSYIVVHELVHANQDLSGEWSVLRAAVVEGGADFLARLALPDSPEPVYASWGRAHDRAVWDRFMAEKDSTDYSEWSGNSGFQSEEWVGDLGYYVGAEIARGYYEQAANKAVAVRELLAMRDVEAILAASGYASRYGAPKTSAP